MNPNGNGERYIDELSHISLSGLRLQDMLDRIVGYAAGRMNADACAILLLDEAGETLLLKSGWGLDLAATNVRIPKDRGICWKVAREKKPIALSVAKESPDYFFVPESGEERYAGMLAVPIIADDESVGVLYIQSRQAKDYTANEINTLTGIADKVSGSIKAGWMLEKTQNKVRVLTGLNEMGCRINATDDINEILRQVIRASGEISGSRTQILWLVNREGEVAASHYPESTGDEKWMQPVRDGIVTHVARTRTAARIDDLANSPFAGLERVAQKSVICQPMIFDEKVVGVILLADRLSPLSRVYYPFTSGEEQALTYLAQTSAQAISRAKTHSRLERTLEENRNNINELSLLFQLSMAMQRPISLDDLLRVILSCVTVGRGLGFNRAVLFLVNENMGMLQGMIGIGPDSGADAARIWKSIDGQMQDTTDLVQWLLNRDPYEILASSFNKLAQTLRTPVHGDSAVARAVAARSPVNITGAHEIGPGDWTIAGKLGCDRFAVVPLVARDIVVGAILVDNLYNNKPITEQDLKLLTRLSAPAAWAIENIRLVERLSAVNKELITLESRLAQVERMSALGEVSAELAHELKNPLVVIGGFARRLGAKMDPEREETGYAGIIVQEVERLERLLQNTLDVSRGVFFQRRLADLNSIIREGADLYWRMMAENGIEARLSLSQEIPEMELDPGQIKQVVINLMLNAVEAMSCDKHDIPKIITVRTEKMSTVTPRVKLVISDTGGGIAERDFTGIYNPFFTTKPNGTGLGLSLCKKIIRLHQGTMEIDNRLGVGVTFTITLPCGAIVDGGADGTSE